MFGGRWKRPRLQLSAAEIQLLHKLRDARTAPWRETQRARILLRYHSGETIAESVIRLIMDNHSAHISKETQTFLSTRPNRFQYVLPPKHGSWLNIVETLFGKM